MRNSYKILKNSVICYPLVIDSLFSRKKEKNLEHKITIKKTARYFTLGNPEKAQNIWIVLHGYSQLAEYFIQKFKALDLDKNFIVAPEGFHRFYRRGTKGRVGASWMTKEARLDDIEDNIYFLNQIAKEVFQKYTFNQKILLGFSQGGATASRWHHKGNFQANIFVLWACVFADDIQFDNDTKGMMQSKNYFIVGDEDEYLKNQLPEIKSFLNQQPFPITIQTFSGTHDIHQPTLLKLAETIEK